MFEGIETAALLICEVIPYNSSLGKDWVVLYNSFTSVMLFCHTIKSLWLRILAL